MTGYAGSRDYVGNQQSPWRTPHRTRHPTKKHDSDPLVEASDPLVASSVHTRKELATGRSLQREGRSQVFQWDVWFGVGSSTETAGSLRNPETRRTPSNAWCTVIKHYDVIRSTLSVHCDNELESQPD